MYIWRKERIKLITLFLQNHAFTSKQKFLICLFQLDWVNEVLELACLSEIPFP